MLFDFEKLHVYQRALDFVEAAFDVSAGLPPLLQSSLGDQLRRASLSIVNNIAEGSDQSSRKKKTVFYEIALHSGRECIPVLTLLNRRSLIKSDKYEEMRELCSEICRMLVGLVKSVES
ncbi:MAG: four helix bundle protein [Candidatus Peribacteraceae bacterium]